MNFQDNHSDLFGIELIDQILYHLGWLEQNCVLEPKSLYKPIYIINMGSSQWELAYQQFPSGVFAGCVDQILCCLAPSKGRWTCDWQADGCDNWVRWPAALFGGWARVVKRESTTACRTSFKPERNSSPDHRNFLSQFSPVSRMGSIHWFGLFELGLGLLADQFVSC